MACWDSYDVIAPNGGVMGSTAPRGWRGCGGCKCCFMTGMATETYSDEFDEELSQAGALAQWLSSEMFYGRMSEDEAYIIMDFFAGLPSYE